MTQARANGITLEYDIDGPQDGEPILLIMGLGAQMTRWPQSFVDALVGHGLKVIRFDNRDIGLSTKLESAGAPDMAAIVGAMAQGRKPDVAYTLAEMATDSVALLDALEIGRAHLVGVSMGGMIGQLIAADYPQRTLSLTSIMSTTGNRDLPGPSPEAQRVLTGPRIDANEDLEAYLDNAVKSEQIIGSPGYPQDPEEVRQRVLSDFRRAYFPQGVQRQMAAAMATPDRRPKLATIKAPTMVIHGADDALANVAGGRDTAANVPGAELLVVEGMGHNLPLPLVDTIVGGIMSAVGRARASASSP
jgi:pimeloyl-ACP methyl ester carboxylesterase